MTSITKEIMRYENSESNDNSRSNNNNDDGDEIMMESNDDDGAMKIKENKEFQPPQEESDAENSEF